MGIVIFGIDAHKRTHTVVAIDQQGRKLGQHTTAATGTADHLGLLAWAEGFGPNRRWAVEDCRHLSRRLEADLLAAGQTISRVPPKLMAHARDAARSYGKSDPIDALAIARAALREPDLPSAHLDPVSRELRLLVDHRQDLVAERTRHINRLRWHLHEIDPGWDPAPNALRTAKHQQALTERLGTHSGVVAQIARDLAGRIHALTIAIGDLEKQITLRIVPLAPALLGIPGVAALTAATIVGQTAGITRFRSCHAFARHNGTAPLPAWSGNHHRHRLTHRQPPTQRRDPPHRDHPSPCSPGRRGLPTTPPRLRQHTPRSDPSPQTPPLRRPLPRPPARRQHRGIDIGARGRRPGDPQSSPCGRRG